MTEKINEFIDILNQNFGLKTFIKLTISDKKDKNNEVKSIIIKPIEIKKGEHFNFVYRYPTKDITKNYTLEEAIGKISEFINTDYNQALLSTSDYEYHFWTKGKKSRIKNRKVDLSIPVKLLHCFSPLNSRTKL